MVGSALSIRCEASSFARLYERARSWDGTLDASLRAELGAAARPAARRAERAALRLRLPGRPPAARHRSRSTGLRSELARSVQVELRQAGAGVTYRIHSDHPMAATTNAPRFRHPVWGDRDTWVAQTSQPWWNLSMRTSTPDMRAAADRALTRALRRL